MHGKGFQQEALQPSCVLFTILLYWMPWSAPSIHLRRNVDFLARIVQR